MERIHKIKIFLLILISLLLPLISAYTGYYVLMEADFLSPKPKFENTDLDCLLFSKKQIFTAPIGFSLGSCGGSNPVEHFSYFYYQIAFPQLKCLVLRC